MAPMIAPPITPMIAHIVSAIAHTNDVTSHIEDAIAQKIYNSPNNACERSHRGCNSPHSACIANADAENSIVAPAKIPIETAKAHTVAVAYHIADATAHTHPLILPRPLTKVAKIFF